MDWLMDFARDHLRNRYFPDKAIDLLEQCVAFGVARRQKQVTKSEAKTVAERMIGMVIPTDERLVDLSKCLRDSSLLDEEESTTLTDRLSVTMRDKDVHPLRPNAVVLLIGEASTNSEKLAETIAGSLFGGSERVVTIDFGRMISQHDISMLLGAPPGYVGYSESLPIHRVAQMPWCVLRCENIDACHPQVREVLAQALLEGFMTDGRGKRVYLSDAVVIATAAITPESRRKLGFAPYEDSSGTKISDAVEQALGHKLADQFDLVSHRRPKPAESQRADRLKPFLSEQSRRYQREGLSITWDTSFLAWFQGQEQTHPTQSSLERLFEKKVCPLLVHHLPTEGTVEPKTVRIRYSDGSLRANIEQ